MANLKYNHTLSKMFLATSVNRYEHGSLKSQQQKLRKFPLNDLNNFQVAIRERRSFKIMNNEPFELRTGRDRKLSQATFKT
jgi:hypothetical protein